MESLQYQGWNFEFDKAATREYYAAHHDECTCASCRNFHKNIEEMPFDVKTFLERFGIDIDNPIEQMSVTALKKENLVEQQVQYCVKGIATSGEGYEIDIGPKMQWQIMKWMSRILVLHYITCIFIGQWNMI